MIFEYDHAKSEGNRHKHGIDFEQAQLLWSDDDLLSILSATITVESRWLFIGMIDGKHWSAIATYRNNAIRLISVRRSRKKEIGAYESRRI